jgi:hypothetical protein
LFEKGKEKMASRLECKMKRLISKREPRELSSKSSKNN